MGVLKQSCLFTALFAVGVSCTAEFEAHQEALANAEVTLAYPAVVSLGSCTATIVAHGIAITAAHCRTDGGHVPLYMHRADGTITKLADVVHWVSHPERTYINHDVAVLFFDPEASKKVGIAPISIDWMAVRRREQLELVGHGGLHEFIPLDYQKRHGVARVVEIESKTAWLERGDRLGVGACSGDSGGPALRITDAPRLVGVITHAGAPCGIETRVQRLDANRRWILQTILTERPDTYPELAGTVRGQLQGVDSGGNLTGWACDPDDPTRAPLVALYYDGRWHVEQSMSQIKVTDGCDGSSHYFAHHIQDIDRLCDEPIVAAAWNISKTPGGSYRLLENSGVRTSCPEGSNHNPDGRLVSLEGHGSTTTASGWATDPDRNTEVWVRFWSANPGPPGIGPSPPQLVEFLGETQTRRGIFSVELATPRWPLQICAFTVNAGAGGADELIGCASSVASL